MFHSTPNLLVYHKNHPSVLNVLDALYNSVNLIPLKLFNREYSQGLRLLICFDFFKLSTRNHQKIVFIEEKLKEFAHIGPNLL